MKLIHFSSTGSSAHSLERSGSREGSSHGVSAASLLTLPFLFSFSPFPFFIPPSCTANLLDHTVEITLTMALVPMLALFSTFPRGEPTSRYFQKQVTHSSRKPFALAAQRPDQWCHTWGLTSPWHSSGWRCRSLLPRTKSLHHRGQRDLPKLP